MTLVLGHFNYANDKNMKMAHGLHHIHSLKLKARQKIWTQGQTDKNMERETDKNYGRNNKQTDRQKMYRPMDTI